jgi:hypothetical protein
MKKLLGSLFVLFILAFSVKAQAADPHPSARLTWSWSQGTGDPATGFHVKRATVAGGPYTTVGTTTVGVLTYLDTTMSVNVQYYYVVTAYNGGGDSTPSNEVSCLSNFLVPNPPNTLSGTTK